MERDQGKKEFEKIEEIASLDGKVALEVGCGDGLVSAFLASKVKNLVAIDPDKEALEKAKENIQGVDFRLGSGEKLEFEDESFDLVLFTLSLITKTVKRL
jgi:ubiquinone/menaquinone biosynthesis C-methylase UbiE